MKITIKTILAVITVLSFFTQNNALAAKHSTPGGSDNIETSPDVSAGLVPFSLNLPSSDLGHGLQALDRQGVVLRANLIDQYARNTRGGVSQGHTNAGQFNIGADLNLDKLIDTRGSSFHFTVYRDYGSGLNYDYTGTFTKQQYIYKNEYNAWHLGLFAFEQKLFDDRLDVIVGRLGTTSYYAKLPTNCQFQVSDGCGLMRMINSESGYSLLPSATWGINTRYRTTPHTYIETGVYEVNPTTAASNGLDFSTSNATGVTVPLEWGWTVPKDFDVKIGGYVSTAPHNDPYYNTAGRSRGLYGGTAREADHERKGVYLLADKVVWRDETEKTRKLTVFGGIARQLEQEETMRQQILSGLVLTGPFASRPEDTVGFSASMYQLSDKERAFLNDSRKKAGGQGSNSPYEYSFEINYGWHVTPGVTVMPNIQYIINPDNSGMPKTPVLPANMLTLGLNVQVSLGKMFGIGRTDGDE